MRKLTHDEISAKLLKPEDLQANPRTPLYGLLDNIRSLYNVGSIFRTSDGALVSKLLLSGYTPKPPRKEIDKTALGATHTVPWEYFADPLDAISGLKRDGIKICVLEHTTRSVPYYRVTKQDFPLCLVVGNEISGVSPQIIAAADLALDIPMFGTKQSLNVSVAYGIALFELLKILRGTTTT